MNFIKRAFCHALKRLRVLFIHNPEMTNAYGSWMQSANLPYVYDPATQRYRPDYGSQHAIKKSVAKSRAKNKAARKSRAKNRGSK